MPNSFIFDPNRCTGCHACRVACAIENELEPEHGWRRIETFNPRHHPHAPLYHLSLACNHCSEPACMYACPALAYRRDERTGAVLLDESKCIGCKYCSWACPYDAPVFDPGRGVMTKCSFCNHRLQERLKPACASLCPTGALDFADLPEADLQHEIDGFPRTRLKPHIHIASLKPGRRLPVMSPVAIEAPPNPTIRDGSSEISLRSEWSLMAFTSLAALLVAWTASAFAGSLSVHPPTFAGGAALAMGLATLHLGRVDRAYRAVLNLRRSWLSREVVAVSSFFALTVVYLWLAPDSLILASLTVGTGFVALFCADQVYSVLNGVGAGYRHSAGALWTGLYLTGVFLGSGWLAGSFGLGKLSLYIFRKARFIELGRPVRPAVSAARLAFGFVLPLALWQSEPLRWHLPIVVAVLIGELLDRAEYYVELESTSPKREMQKALEKRITADALRERPLAAAAAD